MLPNFKTCFENPALLNYLEASLAPEPIGEIVVRCSIFPYAGM